jgi:hypothetical protein
MWVPDLFEGHELAGLWDDDPRAARMMLRQILEDEEMAARISSATRERGIELFGMDTIGPQWEAFLG